MLMPCSALELAHRLFKKLDICNLQPEKLDFFTGPKFGQKVKGLFFNRRMAARLTIFLTISFKKGQQLKSNR